MEKFDTNPFDRSALKDYRLLAGRANEFRQIRFVLRNASKQSDRVKSILITGNRGVGKTSFLNLIEGESLTNNLIPIRINLTETNSENSNEFFWNIFSQTINTLFEFGILGGKGGPIDTAIQKILHSDGLNDPANWVFRTPILRKSYLTNNQSSFEFDLFGQDFKLIRKLVKESKDERFNEKTKILFLVDESQQIYSNSKVIEDIRYIIQTQDLGVGFVFAGDSSYESSTWEDVFGGSYRDFEIINLNYFDNVESVVEYFNKSLQSVGWTSTEIEESLFYRFKLACRNIYRLTSGNPSWINTIASKMFERCMRGEASILKFDRQAQNDVKVLLENGGQLDRVKLEFIEGLTPKMQRWIDRLFDSELYTLSEVYFYSKFILTEGNSLSKAEFGEFCKELVVSGILVSPGFENKKDESGKPVDIGKNFLSNRFVAFGSKSDTIKQWLQISTERKYRFGMNHPGIKFVNDIREDFVSESSNSIAITDSQTTIDKESLRISNVINLINEENFDVNEVSYEILSGIYQLCKKLEKSTEKKVLFARLRNLKSLTSQTWNVYNYDDKGKIVTFNESERKINKYINNVEIYKSESHNYSFELYFDRVPEPDLASLQKAIIACGDKKKVGIIMQDKESALVDFYLKQSNLVSSLQIAEFFFELFAAGHLLKISNLNNSAYVFIVTGELDKASLLLKEAKDQKDLYDLDNDNSSKALILYNLAIIHFIKGEYESALEGFNLVVNFFNELENIRESVGALHLLKTDENNGISLIEIKEGNIDYPKISCNSFAIENRKVLNLAFVKNSPIAQ